MLMRDMFEKNEPRSGCELGVEIVSYLYNEIDGQEKVSFEKHLAGCASCTTEFAALSGITSSVSEWKAMAFDHLKTPAIEIAYNAPTESNGIFARLASLFTSSPWPPVTVGFAAVAVVVVLGFIAFNLQKQEVSVAGEHAPPYTNSPSSAPSPAPSAVLTGNDAVPAKSDDTQNVDKTKEFPGTNVRVVKASETRNPAKTLQPKPVVDTPTPKRTIDKPATQKTPSLNEYAENEDKTLRLTDLFEEIDTRE